MNRPSVLAVVSIASSLAAALLIATPADALQPVAPAVAPATVAASAVPATMSAPKLQAKSRTTMRASWQNLDPDGTAGVSGYRVAVSHGTTTVKTMDVPAGRVSVGITRLHAGWTYQVTVRARDAVGYGSPSPAASIRLRTPNRLVTPHVAATGTASIHVTWHTPHASGGPAVATYQVRVYRDRTFVKAVTTTSHHHSADVAGLHASTRYTVLVRAANGVGYGPGSRKASVTTKRPSAVVRWAAAHFGTFPSRTYHGSGDGVISMPAGAKAGIVSSSAHGEGNFIAWTVNADNTERELVANGIGSYSGTDAFGLERRSTARRIKVTADGDWTITIRPVSSARGISGSHNNDGVYLYGGRAASLRLTNRGESNFVVWQYASPTDGLNLVANEIGDWSGSGLLYRGPSVLTVESDGHWTATVR